MYILKDRNKKDKITFLLNIYQYINIEGILISVTMTWQISTAQNVWGVIFCHNYVWFTC